MKQAKQRVIALDFFRGLCILTVLIDHSSLFSMPLPYLVGTGALWTGAAELFFLISGLTFGVVRDEMLKSDFRALVKKSLRRAFLLYILNTLMVLLSLTLALFLTSKHLTNDVIGALPTTSGFKLLGQILTFSYTAGWANFFMYYSVYLLFAPFLLYAIKTKFWPAIIIASFGLYGLNTTYPLHLMQNGIHASFATWQLYFVLGLVLARFRVPLLSWFYSLPAKRLKFTSSALISAAVLLLVIDCLVTFNLLPFGNRLMLSGWLPPKAIAGYVHLWQQKSWIDSLLMNGRTGLLRPFAAMISLAALYLIYQKYNRVLLERSGKFINALGRDTLWIFAAQALMIPLLAALPLPRTLAYNLILSSFLLISMWALTKRQAIFRRARTYMLDLRQVFNEARYAAMYDLED